MPGIARTDFRDISDIYLDSSAYNLDPAFTNLYLRDPKEIDMRRFNAYRYYMDFYKGKHWDQSGEWSPAYGARSLIDEEYNRRTWNITQALVDKIVSFLVKEPWTIKLPDELDRIGEDNSTSEFGGRDEESDDFDDFGSESKKSDTNFGKEKSSDNEDDGPPKPPKFDSDEDKSNPSDPFDPHLESDPMERIKAEQDKEKPVQDILEAVWRANDREQFSYDMAYMGCITGDCFIKIYYDEDFYAPGMGELRFQVLDSRTVLPFFDGQDRTKLIGARIQYPMYELQADGSKRKRMYKEVHTDSQIVTFLDDELEGVAPNPLGELMVVHIKNEPLPYERYGRSDLESLIIPNKEYNEKLSDISEILAYHAAPVTVVKGARLPALEKGARKVWAGIPPEGDVFNLNLEADLTSSLEYLDRLKAHMCQLGNVPEESLGALQEVSNTSGAAIHLQYQPLLERIQKKRICYGQGLRQINEIIIKFYEAVGALDIPEDISPSLRYQTHIEWGDALPRDRSIDLADISTEIGLGIESRRGALKRLGEENPDAKLREIEEESVRQAELDFVTAGLGGFGDPMAGAMQGTAAGAEDGPQNDVSGAVNAAKTNPNTHGSNVSTQAVKKSAQETTGASKRK